MRWNFFSLSVGRYNSYLYHPIFYNELYLRHFFSEQKQRKEKTTVLIQIYLIRFHHNLWDN